MTPDDGPSLGLAVASWMTATRIANLLGRHRLDLLRAVRSGHIAATYDGRRVRLHLGDALLWSRGR